MFKKFALFYLFVVVFSCSSNSRSEIKRYDFGEHSQVAEETIKTTNSGQNCDSVSNIHQLCIICQNFIKISSAYEYCCFDLHGFQNWCRLLLEKLE